jgi:hypothetical protein
MLRTALRIGAALALTAAPALAQSYSFITSVGTQPGNVGTITLTQNGANSVNVLVDLLSTTYGFLNTGGPHTPFAFNIAGSETGLSAVFTSPAGGSYASGMFSLNTAGGSNTPYGTYGVAIGNSAGNGSGNAYYGDLAFTLTRTGGLTTNDFVANTEGYYFSADLTNGQNTGAQAWSVRTTTGGGGQGSVVPEPSTYVLLASGMVGMVGIARRRKQQA